MATESGYISATGPFRGISCLPWRWNSQDGMRSPLAVNVDFSRGSIRCRPGFETIKRFSNRKVLGLHGFTSMEDKRYIAVVLWDDSNFKTEFNVIDAKGNLVIASNVDMGAAPLGHPPNPYGYVRFIQIQSSLFMTTPHGKPLYYNINRLKTAPKVVKVGDPLPASLDRDELAYFDSLPRASVLHQFGSQLIWAGLSGNEYLSLSKQIPAAQSDLPEDELTSNRDALALSGNAFLWSDPLQATNIRATAWTLIFGSARVTGLASSGGSLLVMTENQILRADPDEIGAKYHLRPLVEGIGCVEARTIAAGGGVTAWMSGDGFYMWDGQQISRISADIDDMFQPGGWRPAPMYKLSANTGGMFPYPFRIAKTALNEASGVYDQTNQCFMWSVPVTGGHERSNAVPKRVLLVFWPMMDSWSIYTGSGRTTPSSMNPTCLSSFYDGTRYRVIFADDWGGIHGFAEHHSDKRIDSTGARNDADVKIQWLWQSPGLQADRNMVARARSLRVEQKAIGASSGIDPSAAAFSYDHKWYIDTEKAFDQVDEVTTSQDNQSASGDLETSPNEAPPLNQNTDHYWGADAPGWGAFKWHAQDNWRVRYSVQSNLVGQSFKVGFSDYTDKVSARQMEIFSFDLEVQGKRDLT